MQSCVSFCQHTSTFEENNLKERREKDEAGFSDRWGGKGQEGNMFEKKVANQTISPGVSKHSSFNPFVSVGDAFDTVPCTFFFVLFLFCSSFQTPVRPLPLSNHLASNEALYNDIDSQTVIS
ncbi:hypothetical protein CDAR_49281 [Caerostris darwini]|uniref:Uncharacterized protein n=1 Tax=Caerostris darwini TaxID=1538125 RepID=A0AAV4QBZ4_9ARAC|nr:hypothetical protein CDAR_49281 [Caerostris darwini]